VSKKEYDFTTGFSHAVAYELQKWDHIRTDEKFYRDMRLDSLKRMKMWTEDLIKRSEEQEELIEHECAVTGKEYK
jgi:hypothetical protein